MSKKFNCTENQVIVTYGEPQRPPVVKYFDTPEEAYEYWKEAVEIIRKSNLDYPCMVTRNKNGSMMSCEIIEGKESE